MHIYASAWFLIKERPYEKESQASLRICGDTPKRIWKGPGELILPKNLESVALKSYEVSSPENLESVALKNLESVTPEVLRP